MHLQHLLRRVLSTTATAFAHHRHRMSTSSNSSNNSNNSLASIQLDFIKGDPLQVADALKSHTPLVLEFWATWVRLCFCFRNQYRLRFRN
jgi:hypothetical protein